MLRRSHDEMAERSVILMQSAQTIKQSEKYIMKAINTNWAWQVKGPYGGATLTPPLSTAASSGFPSTILPSAADTQIRFPNMTFLHSHFPSSITNSGTISPFFFGS